MHDLLASVKWKTQNSQDLRTNWLIARISCALEVSITAGYGERDLWNLGSESALTSVLGTEFTWGGGSAAASTFGWGTASGESSAFWTLLSVEAGRALPFAGDGRSVFPIC